MKSWEVKTRPRLVYMCGEGLSQAAMEGGGNLEWKGWE